MPNHDLLSAVQQIKPVCYHRGFLPSGLCKVGGASAHLRSLQRRQYHILDFQQQLLHRHIFSSARPSSTRTARKVFVDDICEMLRSPPDVCLQVVNVITLPNRFSDARFLTLPANCPCQLLVFNGDIHGVPSSPPRHRAMSAGAIALIMNRCAGLSSTEISIRRRPVQ